METVDWIDGLDEDEEESCLSREVCLEELFRDDPDDCLYCQLGELDGDDGE